MLSFNLIVYSIILILAVQKVKPAISIDQQTCRNDSPHVVAALREMSSIAGFAYTSLDRSTQGAMSPGERRVVYNTFDTFFKALPVRDLISKVNTLSGRFRDIRNRFDSIANL
jgi:hypothetical protein